MFSFETLLAAISDSFRHAFQVMRTPVFTFAGASISPFDVALALLILHVILSAIFPFFSDDDDD